MKQNKNQRPKSERRKLGINNIQLVILSVIILLVVIMTIGSLSLVRRQVDSMNRLADRDYREYKRHYALVTDSFEDNFWSEVYEGARQFSETDDVYLEWFGKDLATDFSKEEILRMAIAAHVDGIILEGDGSDGIRQLIDMAMEEEIPVVTVLSDCYDSKRQSFVGIGNYNLGREYGRQIVRIATKDTKKALVLMDMEEKDSGQNIIYNGIAETLANEGNHLTLELETLAVNDDTPYGEEEVIRGIFQRAITEGEELPDIMICLSEKNTISTYQAVVDYNLVGQVDILGYYVTDTILNSIKRKVISATIAVDSGQMGINSIKALDEYIETGHVNDFVTMDVNAVTVNNVEEYLRDAE